MTRPSEITRERILKAAERLFAERGYDATSVRAIVAKARVNQAAINYHFAGKDGLYRDVLRTAFRALTEDQLAHAEEAKAMSREEALVEFVRRQLQPITARDEVSRYMRIFNWETARPTAVFRKLMREEAAPFMGLAVDLVRRFMPEADQHTLTLAAIWLIGQCSVFVRNREQLAELPVGVSLDNRSSSNSPGSSAAGPSAAWPRWLRADLPSKSARPPQKFLFPGHRPPITHV